MNRKQRRAAAQEARTEKSDPTALLQEALARHQAGDVASAEVMYRQVLAINPAQTDALLLLGNIAHDRGQFQAAFELIGKAIAVKPDVASFHVDFGNVLRRLQRHDEALTSYDRALAIEPGHALACYNRGHTLQHLGRLEEAVEAYGTALLASPDLAPAWINRGNALHMLGRLPEALASHDRAVALAPKLAQAWANRGHVLADLKRPVEAQACFAQARTLVPEDANMWLCEGLTLASQARLAEALERLDRAVALRPDLIRAQRVRAEILMKMSRLEESLVAAEAAIAGNPRDVMSLQLRADALLNLRAYAEARTAFVQVLAAAPDAIYTQGDLLHARMQIADWAGLQETTATLLAAATAGKEVVTPFVLASLPSSPELQRIVAERFASRVIPAASPLPFPAAPNRTRLRIAYLSADLHMHATTHLLTSTLEHHNTERVDILALSYGASIEDSMRQRLRSAVTRFEEIGQLNDEEIAARMRALEIDIAVDLKGYTAQGRPGILAFRGAPVQVSFLGFPGTLGSPAADYILADAWTIPRDAEHCYTEHVVRLPGTYQPCDPTPPPPAPSRHDAGLPPSGFVFCCFNNTYKITPDIFALWMDLLRAVPGSVLWLFTTNDEAEIALRGEARTHGIDPARLIFAPPLPRNEHLARLQRADLALDTLPYNAHTTGRDALIAGVPMVTCPGSGFAGRVGASLVAAAGLEELIVRDLAEYRALALDLAGDPSRLGRLRARLEAGAGRGDPAQFAANLESAYFTMWERYRAGLPPAGFDVA